MSYIHGKVNPYLVLAFSPKTNIIRFMIPKSKVGFILLGVFLGSLGIHNFYAGYTGKAVAQLLITVLSLGILSLASWIWAIVEICTVDKDAKGVPFV